MKFQSLIGILKTERDIKFLDVYFRVSIPHRYSKNKIGNVWVEGFNMFQSLIGILKTQSLLEI